MRAEHVVAAQIHSRHPVQTHQSTAGLITSAPVVESDLGEGSPAAKELGDMSDGSNGYEAIAPQYIGHRGSSLTGVGVETVREWARGLPKGADVLDLGCGSGAPITQLLADMGFRVYGVDASPTMIDAFRTRFPNQPAECATVETSRFFDRPFDAVIAWGLLFLLSPETQALVLQKTARALRSGGHLLFTAPECRCEWLDNLTRLSSISLGASEYQNLLALNGMTVVGETEDEGENHYYFTVKSGDAGLPP